MANYDYTVDYSFKPYSFQEMLAPYMLYKEAYDKAEERAIELSDKSDVFKYLSTELPEQSEARQIYEGYSNDLKRQADALGRHGLTLAIRGGLADMRKRFSGEIGRLERAKTNLDKVNALRLEMGAKDPTMLYATNNLSIDNFLDEKMPNMYGISSNDIYAQGFNAGKALATSKFSAGDGASVIGGYYVDFVQRVGYSAPELLRDKEALNREFRKDLQLNHPELFSSADSILNRLGVNQNLTGIELERARASVLDGIVDGAMATYKEDHSPQRDLGKMTASEAADYDLRKKSYDLQKAEYYDKLDKENLAYKMRGWVKDEDGWKYNPSESPLYKEIVGGYENEEDGKKAADAYFRAINMGTETSPSPAGKTPGGKSSSSSSATKPTPVKDSRGPVLIDSKGNIRSFDDYKDFINGTSPLPYAGHLGKQISYDEAVKISPSTPTHVDGKPLNYYYYKYSDNNVLCIPKDQVDNPTGSPTSTPIATTSPTSSEEGHSDL